MQGGGLTTVGEYPGKLILNEQHTCVLHCTGSPGLISSPIVGLGSLVDYRYVPTGETFGMWPETQHFGQLVKLHHF